MEKKLKEFLHTNSDDSTTVYYNADEVDELIKQHAQQIAEAQAIIAARQRVRDSFGHRDDNGKCQCVYCRRDIDGLVEHAADYEMQWFSESRRAVDLAEQITEKDREIKTALEATGHQLAGLSTLVTTYDTLQRNNERLEQEVETLKQEQKRDFEAGFYASCTSGTGFGWTFDPIDPDGMERAYADWQQEKGTISVVLEQSQKSNTISTETSQETTEE